MKPENVARRLGLNPVRRAKILVPAREYRSETLSARVTRLDDSALTDAQRFVSAVLEKGRNSPWRLDGALLQAVEVCRLMALELEMRADS